MSACIVRRRLQIFGVIACAVLALLSSAGAKPTLNFSFAKSFSPVRSLQSFTQQFVEKRAQHQMKTYSGHRIQNDSLIMIYHNDQTIAVVELGPDKLLLGCELIEIYNDEEGQRLLKQLSDLNEPLEINFSEMIKLMKQCDMVEKLNATHNSVRRDSKREADPKQALFPRSPLSLLNGIIPGTKWCGTGDIARTYKDLGTEMTMDRCCRTHDLCPMKVRAFQRRYELHNESIYTKSHCICDDMLFSCLKKTNTSAAQFMGSIYFNLVQVPCIHKVGESYEFRPAREGF